MAALNYFAVVEDYFDAAKRLRVFVCHDCGALVADRDGDVDGLEVHRAWHVKLARAGVTS